MSTPAAGSRPAITSQNAAFDLTPTPSGAGQVISGATLVGGAGGGGRRADGLRVCADNGTATTRAIAIARMCAVYRSLRACRAPQVGIEKVFDPLPRVAQDVLAGEVVELARIGHERDEIAFAFLQQLIYLPHRVQVRDVHV